MGMFTHRRNLAGGAVAALVALLSLAIACSEAPTEEAADGIAPQFAKGGRKGKPTALFTAVLGQPIFESGDSVDGVYHDPEDPSPYPPEQIILDTKLQPDDGRSFNCVLRAPELSGFICGEANGTFLRVPGLAELTEDCEMGDPDPADPNPPPRCPWTSNPDSIFPPISKGKNKENFATNFGATVHLFSWVPIDGEQRRYNIVWEDVKVDVRMDGTVKQVTGTQAVIFKQPNPEEDVNLWKIPSDTFVFNLDLTVTEVPSGN